ncbi:heavy-metal-associated domain-containing protein [Taibaiella koreensis]|uniref:heavy-metal-associated domain-containing protein n=1 Tax=Taibaiella koreensis TaxID=1268548 RepID=UPI001F08A175|nr:cation transporter [Taibaiella koreensis]
MKNIHISVPDMQSSHCQARVQQALNAIEGAVITHIEAGALNLSAPDDMPGESLKTAIEKAGYAVAQMEAEVIPSPLQFRTNINCGGCVAQVKPALDALAGVSSWQVDTTAKDKILSVSGVATVKEIMDTIRKSGFKIELMHT